MTEFVSAMANFHAPQRSRKKMVVSQTEKPVAIQIFGGELETMVMAASTAEELGADIVDINMGCWVPKVVRTGSGAALLKDPEMAARIVDSVVKAVKIPVSVKIRSGWKYGMFVAPDLVKRFQDVGAQMITLHARFASQGFEGEADWSLIEELRKVVTVPFVGNGDVKTPEDAKKLQAQTGVDGVMIGRAAIANPWILASMNAEIMGQLSPPQPTIKDRAETALKHLSLHIDYESIDAVDPLASERAACRSLRGQMPMYMKGFPGAVDLRKAMTQCDTYAEYEQILNDFLESEPVRAIAE